MGWSHIRLQTILSQQQLWLEHNIELAIMCRYIIVKWANMGSDHLKKIRQLYDEMIAILHNSTCQNMPQAIIVRKTEKQSKYKDQFSKRSGR